MDLHEYELKKIIEEIEKIGAVSEVKILNSSILVSIPRKNKLVEIDLNKPLTYSITFMLGSEKETNKIGRN